MANPRTGALIDAGVLARALATGAAGAALSAERNPRLVRGLGLAVAAGAGTWVALAATGVVPSPGSDDETAPQERPDVPPAVAAGIGLGLFAVTAAVSEAGLWAQRRLERWADETVGRPRLVVGVLTGGLSLAIDVAERVASDQGVARSSPLHGAGTPPRS